ncbi:MAG: hypothetical protein H0T46_10235 [Deltaproteobacteria bacterium]|nr:hypothetical protein [Deltaproteobacteria bacterium]
MLDSRARSPGRLQLLDYCFLRGVLPDGTDKLMSYVDVTAGTATKPFDVLVVRGEY